MNDIKIDPKLLPVPLEYTYPIVPMKLSVIVGNDHRHATIYYVSEISRYVRYDSAVKEIIERRGITWIEWKTRWFLKMPSSKIGTTEWADRYIEVFYSERFSETKKIIKENLLKDSEYVCDFWTTRSDLIEAYIKSRENSNRDIYRYDFSKVPERLKKVHEKFLLFCEEIDPYTNQPYGEYKVDYGHFINAIRDHPKLSNRIGGEKRSVVENSKGIFIAEHIEEIKDLLRDGYSSDAIGQMLGGIRGTQIAKSIRNHYNFTVTELKGDVGMSSGEVLVKNFLVSNNITYKSQVTVKGIEGRNRNSVRVDFIVPSLKGKEIWIEYNGKQHYEKIAFFNQGKDGENVFEKQKKRDANVREYCKTNSILLVEVPYILFSEEKVNNFLFDVIFNDIDPNTLVDYTKLYK